MPWSLSSIRSAYQSWWLGDERADPRAFMAEEFLEVQKSIRLLMAFGAAFFLLRGLLEIGLNVGPDWILEVAFRLVISVVLLGLYVLYGKIDQSQAKSLLFCLYLLVYISATMAWSLRYDLHPGFMAVPLVLCLSLALITWPHLRGLHWPAIVIIGPTLVMLLMQSASRKDWIAYALCFLVAILFSVVIRRTRLRTSFTLFAYRQKLEQRVDHDPLTGVFNRTGWQEQVESILARQSPAKPVPIVFFDIDHFKKVNDRHGHAVGDRVLVHTVKTIAKVLREGDILARIGGEEFVVALPGASLVEAGEVAHRVRSKLSSSPGPVPITISAGVGQIDAGHNMHQAMETADRGLLEAKRNGRDRVCLLPPLDHAPPTSGRSVRLSLDQSAMPGAQASS